MEWSSRNALPLLVLSVGLLVSTGRAAPTGFTAGGRKLPQVTANSITLDSHSLQPSKNLLVLPACQPLLGQTWLLADNDDDTTSYQRIVYRKPLSKGTGVFLALVPGAAVHGLGNIYARNYSLGYLLLCAELIGVYFHGLAPIGIMDMEDYALPSIAAPIAGELAWVGLFLIAGSWIMDIFTVDSAVERYNNYANLSIKTSHDGMKICLSFAF
jgi:hypothetical protein